MIIATHSPKSKSAFPAGYKYSASRNSGYNARVGGPDLVGGRSVPTVCRMRWDIEDPHDTFRCREERQNQSVPPWVGTAIISGFARVCKVHRSGPRKADCGRRCHAKGVFQDGSCKVQSEDRVPACPDQCQTGAEDRACDVAHAVQAPAPPQV